MLPALEKLTDQQRAFVSRICAGYVPSEAATLSGYAQPGPQARSLLRHAGVLAAIREETNRLIVAEDAPLGRKTLREICQDTAAPPNARVAAAKTLIAIAGYVAPKTATESPAKPLNEQSSDDLRALVDKLESELANRAKPAVITQAVDWKE